MKNEKFNDISEWLPIKDYTDQIDTKFGTNVKVLEVKPINFKLRSESEQMSILEAYKRFLKQCNFEMQIVVQAYKTNVKEHLKRIEKYSYGNEKLRNIMENYKGLITNLIGEKTSITRKFFIILKIDKNITENINKIMVGLNACGNEVSICDESKLKEILEMYFKKNKFSEEMVL